MELWYETLEHNLCCDIMLMCIFINMYTYLSVYGETIPLVLMCCMFAGLSSCYLLLAIRKPVIP